MKTLFIFFILFFPGVDPPPSPSDTSRPEAQAETGRQVLQKIEKQVREKIPPSHYQNMHKNKATQFKSRPFRAKGDEELGSVIGGLIIATIATGFILLIRFNVPFGVATLINLGFHLILILLSLLGIAADKKRRANEKPPKAKNLAGALGIGVVRASKGCASSVVGIMGVVLLVLLFGITTLFLYFESTVVFFVVGGVALLAAFMSLLSYLFGW
ncbi:hypothetical protein [uncultured Microscilla sp.]|uniref:hypothetical protein n=1 Tax=uncultured Microscilla sp. TaxID=432653 RepID=UPI0026120C28|nr:hypothetical protein [uncultured Microscilla sp.]